MSTTLTTPSRVLLERVTGGIRVEVLWHPVEGLSLYVDEGGEHFPITVAIPGDRARDAFEHPFTYVPEHLRS